MNSTFEGNSAFGGGGALNTFGGATLDVANSTLAYNDGGAVFVDEDAGPASVRHATIAYNTGVGLAVAGQSKATVGSSILAFNALAFGKHHMHFDCDGAVTSAGHNLDSYDDCGFPAGAVNVNPLLGPLTDNGGPAIGPPCSDPDPRFCTHNVAKTMGLRPASPALDAIPAANCPPPAMDERRTARPQGGDCDIGAFEGTVATAAKTCAGVPATIQGTDLRNTDTDGKDVIVGTVHRDVIFAGSGADLVFGGGGNDLICGGQGDDRLFGGDGNDRLIGGMGKDALEGGHGHNRLTP